MVLPISSSVMCLKLIKSFMLEDSVFENQKRAGPVLKLFCNIALLHTSDRIYVECYLVLRLRYIIYGLHLASIELSVSYHYHNYKDDIACDMKCLKENIAISLFLCLSCPFIYPTLVIKSSQEMQCCNRKYFYFGIMVGIKIVICLTMAANMDFERIKIKKRKIYQ
ncbi:hypothetical protein KUTeg_022358 [Tegillarca granosa]|uniref:Uncharacterized protein n=1 Tax=Tegillarca granosa TaxID=220873 RepID=A0ABQ9E8V4_TEGGR|nr:hypothetical protein KUTeg_022358 [Tegillarca granosa]